MRRDMVGQPGIGLLFAANLAACGLVFLVALGGFFLLAVLGSGLEAALGLLLVGGFYGAILAGSVSLFVIAPIGTVLALVLVRLFGPGWWLGPALGGTAGVVFFSVLLFGFLPEGIVDGADDLVAFALLVAVAAIAGHVAQRTVLRWPER